MTETDNQRDDVCNRTHGGSPYKIAEHIVLPGDKTEWFVEPTGERHPIHAGTREQAELLADAMEQAWRDGAEWRALSLHPWWDDVIGPLLDAAVLHSRGEDHMPSLRDAEDALRYLRDNDPNDTGGRAAYARRCELLATEDHAPKQPVKFTRNAKHESTMPTEGGYEVLFQFHDGGAAEAVLSASDYITLIEMADEDCEYRVTLNGYSKVTFISGLDTDGGISVEPPTLTPYESDAPVSYVNPSTETRATFSEGDTPDPAPSPTPGFTPGPWGLGEGPQCRTIYGPTALAQLVDNPDHSDRYVANAHLVAAAPDMYAELDKADSNLRRAASLMTSVVARDDATQHCRHIQNEVLPSIRRTLARARGVRLPLRD